MSCLTEKWNVNFVFAREKVAGNIMLKFVRYSIRSLIIQSRDVFMLILCGEN